MAKLETRETEEIVLSLGGPSYRRLFRIDPEFGQVLYKGTLVDIEGLEEAQRLEDACKELLKEDAHFEDPEDLCGGSEPSDIWESVSVDSFIDLLRESSSKDA